MIRAYRVWHVLSLLLLGYCISMSQPGAFSPDVKPEKALPYLKILLGEYVAGDTVLSFYETGGDLAIARQGKDPVLLREAGFRQFVFDDGSGQGRSEIRFDGKPGQRPASMTWRRVRYTRRPFDGEDGETFTIRPLYSPEELQRRARLASPPREEGEWRRTDLVELKELDPTILYDIRYATTNNFMRQKFYTQAKAFLQRPAAEAFVRAHRWLAQYGYGLLVHDAYRPWKVTKMFWDATPEKLKDFVANPTVGSRHNRGCAVDVTLYDRKTGQPVEMVSGYDEFSQRAHPDYAGGTSLQRWHRALLRHALEREGFTVYRWEWWHFDYKGWERYRIQDLTFEELDKGKRK